jgi:hypothetical protein
VHTDGFCFIFILLKIIFFDFDFDFDFDFACLSILEPRATRRRTESESHALPSHIAPQSSTSNSDIDAFIYSSNQPFS